MRIPDDPGRRTRACLKLAAASVVAASLVAASTLVLAEQGARLGVPWPAVRAAMTVVMLAGMAGAAYAVLQLPLRLSRRVAAAVAAFARSYVAFAVCTWVALLAMVTIRDLASRTVP